jgi:ATP-dependent RNA helicase DDX41
MNADYLVLVDSTLLDAKKTQEEKEEEADNEILDAIKNRRKLASDLELAKDIQYTESLKSRLVDILPIHHPFSFLCRSWRPPRFIREQTKDQHDRLREKYHILIEGEDVPPAIESFSVGGMVCFCSNHDSHAIHRK